MGKNYEKYSLNIDAINGEYIYWKKIEPWAEIWIESYKEKRGIYVMVRNILPSYFLNKNNAGVYHIVIEDLENLQHDLGEFHIGPKGEGNLYKHFKGLELDKYEKVLIVIKGKGQITSVVEASMPWEKFSPWDYLFQEAFNESQKRLFGESVDETGARWYVVPFDQSPYGHLALGVDNQGRRYVGVPGRFLVEEQAECEEGKLTLWQPIRGGEAFYEKLEDMDESLVKHIYGYWIGVINEEKRLVIL